MAHYVGREKVLPSTTRPTPRILALTAMFALSFGLGLLFVDQIELPFSNPWDIKGPLAAQAYNPNNDVVRFLFLVFLPSACLALCWINKRSRDFLTVRHDDLSSFRLTKNGSARFKALLAVLVFVALFFSTGNTFRDYPLDTFHEGETLGPATDYIHGKIPYKETVFIHGPYADPLRGVLAFALFGESIGALRTLDAVSGIIIPVVFLVMLYFLFSRNIYYAALVFSVYLMINHFRPFGAGIHLGSRNLPLFLFVIVAALLKDRVSVNEEIGDARGYILLFFFTFIPTLAFSFSVDRGIFLTIAATSFIIAFCFLFLRSSTLVGSILAILGGYVAGLFVFGLTIKGAYLPFFTYISTLLRYEGIFNGFIYPFWDIRFLLPVMLISISVYWLLYRFLSFQNRVKLGTKEGLSRFFAVYFMEIILLLSVGTHYRRPLGRSDLAHINGILVTVFILGTFIVFRHYILPSLQNKGMQTKLIGGFSLVLLAGYLILAVPATNWAHIYRFPLNLPDSTFIPKSYVETVEYLKQNMNEEDDFLTLTSEASWYYFLDKPCPIRFNVIYQAMPPFYQDEIISDLQTKNVRYILYKNSHWANVPEGYDIKDRLPDVVSYIHEHFAFCKQIGGNEIWIKTAVPQT